MKKMWHMGIMGALIIALMASVFYPMGAYGSTDPYLPLAQAGLRSIYDGIGNPIIRQHLWHREHVKIGGKDVYLYEFLIDAKIGRDDRFDAMKEILNEHKDAAFKETFSRYLKYYVQLPVSHTDKKGIEAYDTRGTILKNANVGIAVVVENGKPKVMGWFPMKDIVLFPLKDLLITKDMWKKMILKDYKIWLELQDKTSRQ